MEIKSKSLDEINEITDDTKAGITTTILEHTINFEKYKKMYGGESEIFKILLEELKKGTFSDCDEEFQYCCYQIISNLQQENQSLKKQLEENKNPLKGIFAQVNDDMLLRNCGAMQSEIDTYKNQQKEFIKYLEEKEKQFDILGDPKNAGACKGILQKYKEIVGE